MRSLLIDDFRTFETTSIARSYDSAISQLMYNGPWDIVYIDHDLGEDKTGYDIIVWLENNKQYLPKNIVCISANPPGRDRINMVIDRLYEEPSKEYFAHPSAIIDDGVKIGRGTKIWHNTHVMKGAEIGENCSLGQSVFIGPNVKIGNGVKIQNNVNIYEGVTVGNHVFFGPNSTTTNDYLPRAFINIPGNEYKKTVVMDGASICAGAILVCRKNTVLTIGNLSVVGAGAVVIEDVPNKAIVVGNPARVVGYDDFNRAFPEGYE